MYKIVTLLFLTLSLASCYASGTRPASEFKENWESSKNHSSVSWWYVGESDYSYFITEKHPLKHYSYEVPKSLIKLEGVTPMEPCKACDGVNLKTQHVQYNE